MFQVDRILTRKPSVSFQNCIRHDASSPIDLDLMNHQHLAYVKCLSQIVSDHNQLDDDPALPDCVFIEDTCVVLDHETVLITNPGAPSRRAEVQAVQEYLTGELRVHTMVDPATLDGGDVLRVGQTLIAGRSERSNEAGIQLLRDLAKPLGIETRSTPLPKGLHFKSACSLASPEVLLYDPSVGIDLSVFEGLSLDLIAVPEKDGANVLALPQQRVIVSQAAPRTARILEQRGLDVTILNISEMHKADGALTCPSVRLPAKGHWCT
ncbi:dimethylarginine dimethylaminohydrolase family protein [Pseudobacteriovorax antillogorgiicola]|uniref:Dimethylargininase n=1 Tax=Pseudobacteriovorax antillogorgiicola TaxID=1513793 RepID=A0A1Y6BBY3_9BACT|nr:hypothetical protein [Pseudobacteriovorax antillogorgiicola]TCS57388.1 dimethylargininase [Pseudobacteriovorax antillogorgiicola]SMF01727.1 dimethylargininase [Pseudobacteriovorax antillogorgiicola]